MERQFRGGDEPLHLQRRRYRTTVRYVRVRSRRVWTRLPDRVRGCPSGHGGRGAVSESPTVDGVLLLAQQHPELDWSDPEGALETLAILNDPEAMADLEEAEHDIAAGNLLPLDRYAPPG